MKKNKNKKTLNLTRILKFIEILTKFYALTFVVSTEQKTMLDINRQFYRIVMTALFPVFFFFLFLFFFLEDFISILYCKSPA